MTLCEMPHPRLVCAEYFKSQAVVQAKLVSVKYVPERNGASSHLYRMQTLKVQRGEIGQSFDIYEENSSGRATFDWKPGRPYLLFLHFYSKADGGWVIDGCGNSGPLSKAQVALKKIDEISQAKDGIIQVVIGGNWTSYSAPLRGARVRARDSEHSYWATTNSSGVANVHVPSGEYKVSIPGERNLTLFDLSYEDPQKVTIEAGGCAQIQFVASQ
jgi:hypothetical protein